jgi:NADPH2:quinone reductase
MKAIQIKAHGGPEALVLAELAVPEPAPNQVLVRIEAAGVNFIDVYHRTGLYTVNLPYVPGQEAAGTVETVGEEVTGLAAGDRGAWAGVAGAYAEYACVPAEKLVKLPEHVDCEQGAAAMLQVTAHYLCTSTFPLAAGHTCLVHAAAGGVGPAGADAACAAPGATTAGSARRPNGPQGGADEVILYNEKDFVAEVKRLTGGRGVRVVYDSVGRTTFLKSLDCLEPRGMMVCFGQSSGKIRPSTPASCRQNPCSTRPTLWHHADRLACSPAGVLFDWIDAGSSFYISQVLPLEQAAEAHRLLEGRQTMGKLLLSPA